MGIRAESSVLPQFLLTRPSRGAITDAAGYVTYFPISTHTPLAGRDFPPTHLGQLLGISTHTPLAGRDFQVAVMQFA